MQKVINHIFETEETDSNNEVVPVLILLITIFSSTASLDPAAALGLVQTQARWVAGRFSVYRTAWFPRCEAAAGGRLSPHPSHQRIMQPVSQQNINIENS